MTTATVTESVSAGPTEDVAEVEQALQMLWNLRSRFQSQREIIGQQRAEIERLSQKVFSLREQLDQFFRHHQATDESLAMTPELLKEHQHNGVAADEFVARVTQLAGN